MGWAETQKEKKTNEAESIVASQTLWIKIQCEKHLSESAWLWVIDEMATALEDREQSYHASASVLCSSRDSHW